MDVGDSPLPSPPPTGSKIGATSCNFPEQEATTWDLWLFWVWAGILISKRRVGRCQHPQELDSPLPTLQNLLESVLFHRLPKSQWVFVSEPLSLPFSHDFQHSLQPGTGLRGGCEAARTLREHTAAVGSSADSTGNSGHERGWSPRDALLGC